MNSGLREFQSWVLSLHREDTGAPAILCSLFQRFICLSPFLTLLPKFSSPCYLTLAYRETFSLSSDAWTRTGLKPSWGRKLEFALCSLQRWVPLTSLFLPLGFECDPWDAIKVDNRQFGAPLRNELGPEMLSLGTVNSRSLWGQHLFVYPFRSSIHL